MKENEACRFLSSVADAARRAQALFAFPAAKRDLNTIHISGRLQGELSLKQVGSRLHPDYDIVWETNTEVVDLAPGQPSPQPTQQILNTMSIATVVQLLLGDTSLLVSRDDAARHHFSNIVREVQSLGVDLRQPSSERSQAYNMQGSLEVRKVDDVDDFRVIWTSPRVSNAKQTDVTNLTLEDAMSYVLGELQST